MAQSAFAQEDLLLLTPHESGEICRVLSRVGEGRGSPKVYGYDGDRGADDLDGAWLDERRPELVPCRGSDGGPDTLYPGELLELNRILTERAWRGRWWSALLCCRLPIGKFE